jgi:hypothetical protein
MKGLAVCLGLPQKGHKNGYIKDTDRSEGKIAMLTPPNTAHIAGSSPEILATA